MKTTAIKGLIDKLALKHSVRGEKKVGSQRSGSKSQPQAFGDFFVREDRATGIRPERPSKYTSYTLSEGFQRETEEVYVAKLLRSATWKLDTRLIPIMALFYFLSELGRLSINNIRSIGLQADLRADDSQYTLSLIVTLIPLILVEIPSNFIMLRIGARFFFPLILTVLGLILFCHGFLSNYAGLLVARFFVGLVNGGLFPGFLLYLSSFYTRGELQWRMALFYSTGCMAGGLSGSLSYAITRLDGALGLAGWAWVFLIEGILTMLGGSVGFLFFPASPDDSGFLTADEKRAVSDRLHGDRSPLTEGCLLDAKPFRSSGFQICQALRSPHVGLCCLAFFLAGTNVTSLIHFQSSILNSLGHGSLVSQILSIPPYGLAVLTILISSYLSDKYRSRAMASVVSGGVSAVGYSILYISDDSSLKYFSLFLIIIGAYGVIPCLAAWMSNNSEPYARKAASLALGPIAANLGGLISTLLFPNSDQSNLSIAVMVNIVFAMLLILSCLANLGYLTYVEAVKIHRRDEVLQHYALNDLTVDPTVQELLYLNGWEYLGDRHPDFKYSF